MATSSGDPLWARLEVLFDEVLELPAAARHAWLERIGRDDPSLRARLEALLAADAGAGVFLEGGVEAWLQGPSPEAAPSSPDSGLAPGTCIGPYRIVREIGRGGMGVVHAAERADGTFEQRVALKLVAGGGDRAEVLARFHRERQILARLDHPAIARILDGGAHADGRPWFAMELIDGEPVTEYCDRRRMPIDERLRLFVRICDAVEYAHRNLVVHRDLKPSNIFVTANGDLKLLDFGIAKVLDEDSGSAGADATRAGLRLLTPAYAAPEQLRGEPVSLATDVYSLGVLLFQLLTGQRPFAASSDGELERAVLEQDPPQPSLVPQRGSGDPAGDAANRGLSPNGLRTRLSGDLDAIVLNALRKEPPRRYGSAVALGDDLRRHLDGQPVRARPDGRRYRASKFIKRHRLGVAMTAALLLLLVGGLAATAWQARRTAVEAQKAEAVKTFLVSIFRQADPARASARDITLRQVVDQGVERLDRELAGQPAVQAELLTVLTGVYTELGVIDRAGALADRALATHERLEGSNSSKVAVNLRQKASLALAAGQTQQAERSARRALAIHQQTSGSTDPEVAEDLDVLAMALRQAGRSAEALTAVEESLAIRQQAFGDEHRLVAESMTNLAVLLREQGRYAEAADLYERAVTLRRRLLGDEHPHVALTLHNFSALQYFRGEYDDATTLSEETLRGFRRLYGEDHQLTLAARSTRAAIDRVAGRFDAAEAGYQTVLETWRQTEGEDHPNAMVTLGGLARLYRERGEPDRAARILRELDARWRARMGTDHPIGAQIRRQFGGVLAELGHHEEAGRLLTDALGQLRAAYGTSHPEVAESLYELGRLAHAQGSYAEAESLLRQSLTMRRQVLGEHHVLVAQSLAAVGAVRLAQGDASGARASLETALAVMERALPDTHPLVLSAQRDLMRARDHERR
jgi:serine/threonine-protein kinase